MNAPTTHLTSRAAGGLLTVAIVALAAATSYIHLTLGGLLFLLNGLGYLGLIVLIVVVAIAPHPLIARFDWFPRMALIGYTATTIAGYLVIGPYFALGWITKGIELTLIALVVVDIIRVYGSVPAMTRRALGSLTGRVAQADASPSSEPVTEAPRIQAEAQLSTAGRD